MRREVEARAHECCEYCHSQKRFSPDPFSIEHIIPLSKGGDTKSDNLAFSCQGCNNHKYNHLNGIDITTGKKIPLYNPRQQKWIDHFNWNEDFSLLIGITPTGRATIQRLDLNRAGVVNLRKVLYSLGKHPL